MPLIDIKVNETIEDSIKDEIKNELGQAITLIAGKSEDWLMVCIEDESSLYFQGSDEIAAYVEVKIYGEPSPSECDALTSRITEIVHEKLGVRTDRTYVSYFSTDRWGFDGSDF